MNAARKIKNITDKITGFFQYQLARMKNHYPCRLIAERREKESNSIVIVFRILGVSRPLEIFIQDLLSDARLIAGFHPADAQKIGWIALEAFLSAVSYENRQQTFTEVKNVMLNSTHERVRIQACHMSEWNQLHPLSLATESFPVLFNLILKNSYPCRLVGGG